MVAREPTAMAGFTCLFGKSGLRHGAVQADPRQIVGLRLLGRTWHCLPPKLLQAILQRILESPVAILPLTAWRSDCYRRPQWLIFIVIVIRCAIAPGCGPSGPGNILAGMASVAI